MSGRVLVLVFAGEAACGTHAATPDAGGDAGLRQEASVPREAGAPGAQLISFSASTIESFGIASEQVRLELTIANIGGTPVNNVGVFTGRVEWPGNLTLAAQYALDPSEGATPLAPGETRTFVFLANQPNLGACAGATLCEANPHLGLMSTSAEVLSDVASWDISTVVALTCSSDYPTVCAQSVADACHLTDSSGAPLFRCVTDWANVLTDNLCGIADFDGIADCREGHQMRTIEIGNVFHQYYYTSGLLVEIDRSQDGVCVGGPCDEHAFWPVECQVAQAFYSCVDAGAPDATAPDASPM